MDKLFNGDWKSECLELREEIATLRTRVAALEKLLHLDDTSYLTQNWGLSSEQIKVIEEALKERV